MRKGEKGAEYRQEMRAFAVPLGIFLGLGLLKEL
jgi:hypothetical protein